MANPHSQAGHGFSGRNKVESPLADGQAPGGEKNLRPVDPLRKPQDPSAPAEGGEAPGERSEADWGLDEPKPGMGRETKICLAVIVLLLCAFSFVVFQKIQEKQARLAAEAAAAKEQDPETEAGAAPEAAKAVAGATDDSPFDDPALEEESALEQTEPAQPSGKAVATTKNPFDSEDASPDSDAGAEIVNLDGEATESAEIEPAASVQQEPVAKGDDPFAQAEEPAVSRPAPRPRGTGRTADELGGYEPVAEDNAAAGSATRVFPSNSKTSSRSPRGTRNGPRRATPTDLDQEFEMEEIATEGARSSIQVGRPDGSAEFVPEEESTSTSGSPPSASVERLVPLPSDAAEEFTPGAPAGAGRGLPLAASEIYVVQPHDNYWTISRKRYGTIRYFMALARHNESRIADPRHLRPGMQISTPPREVLEQRYAGVLPVTSSPGNQLTGYRGSPGANGEPALQSGFFVSTAGEPMFCVGPQDTLTSISQQTLGRSSRWDEIFGLNRETLPNPDTLNIGTVLKLPHDASQSRLVRNPTQYR